MSNIEAIKKKLISLKHEFENKFSNSYKEKVPQDIVQDTADQAMSSAIEDLNISIYNSEFDDYKAILKALEMIENGTYGICVDCKRPIPEKRLLLMPTSTRCISCQESLEES